MGSVEDQFQTAARGNLTESLDVAGVSPDMHANDASRPRCDRLLYLPGVEGLSSRIDVAKHRRDPLPPKGVGRGDKSEGWNDDLAFHPEGTNRDLQANGAIAHRDTVLHSDQVGDSLLELSCKRTVVGEPASVENLVEAFKQSPAITDLGPAD